MARRVRTSAAFLSWLVPCTMLLVPAGAALAQAESAPSDDVDTILKYAPPRIVIVEGKTPPQRSPWTDPQATTRPVPKAEPAPRPKDTIPAEILNQYDDDILEGNRPTYAILYRKDIFRLRETPRFQADFVRFDLKIDELSTVQREILKEWLQGGHNRVMLMGGEIGQFADFMEIRPGLFRSGNDARPRQLRLRHPFATAVDCNFAYVPFDWRETELSRDYDWEGIIACRMPTRDVVVFADYLYDRDMLPRPDRKEKPMKEDDRVAAYGRFSCGKTEVYFRPFYLATGGDGDRFELNWSHWVLGREIPGPTRTSVPRFPAPKMPRSDAQPADATTQPSAMAPVAGDSMAASQGGRGLVRTAIGRNLSNNLGRNLGSNLVAQGYSTSGRLAYAGAQAPAPQERSAPLNVYQLAGYQLPAVSTAGSQGPSSGNAPGQAGGSEAPSSMTINTNSWGMAGRDFVPTYGTIGANPSLAQSAYGQPTVRSASAVQGYGAAYGSNYGGVYGNSHSGVRSPTTSVINAYYQSLPQMAPADPLDRLNQLSKPPSRSMDVLRQHLWLKNGDLRINPQDKSLAPVGR